MKGAGFIESGTTDIYRLSDSPDSTFGIEFFEPCAPAGTRLLIVGSTGLLQRDLLVDGCRTVSGIDLSQGPVELLLFSEADNGEANYAFRIVNE